MAALHQHWPIHENWPMIALDTVLMTLGVALFLGLNVLVFLFAPVARVHAPSIRIMRRHHLPPHAPAGQGAPPPLIGHR